MTIAFDVYTTFAGTGNPVAGSHAAASSGVKGVLVLLQSLSNANQASAVTYGGVSMVEDPKSPVTHATGELGQVQAFSLGASVPQGTQTVSVTRAGTGSLKVHVFTVTAAADIARVDSQILNSDSLANPSLLLDTPAGVETFIAATLFSGQDDPLNVTPDAAYTQANEFDYGTKVGNTIRRTAIATGGLIACGWTQTAEDAVVIGVAIREVAPAASGLIVGPIPIVAVTSGGGGPSPLLVPDAGAWFGVCHNFETLTQYETRVGRLVENQDFESWTSLFPTAAQKDLTNVGGRISLFNWKMTPGWAAVASGAQDAVIDAAAARFIAWGKRFLLAIHHEPENDVPASGTPANYRAAFRHVVERLRAQGVTNAIFVWKVMGGQFNPLGTAAYAPGALGGSGDSVWPGDDVVDWVMYDPYNGYGCTTSTWRTFEEIADPSIIGNFSMYDHSATNWPSKPLGIAETGTNEHDALSPTKATWFTEMLSSMKNNLPRIKGMWYFHAGPPTFCDRYIHTSPEAQAAMAAVGADPYFNPTRPTF